MLVAKRHSVIVRGMNRLAFAALILTGCYKTVVVSGVEISEREWTRSAEAVTARAAFDLSCPAEQLSLTLLGKVGRHPNQIGVDGCGHRIVYVRPDLHFQTWVANVESRPGASSPTE